MNYTFSILIDYTFYNLPCWLVLHFYLSSFELCNGFKLSKVMWYLKWCLIQFIKPNTRRTTRTNIPMALMFEKQNYKKTPCYNIIINSTIQKLLKNSWKVMKILHTYSHIIHVFYAAKKKVKKKTRRIIKKKHSTLIAALIIERGYGKELIDSIILKTLIIILSSIIK